MSYMMNNNNTPERGGIRGRTDAQYDYNKMRRCNFA